MTPAWIVYAWPRVLCDAHRAPRLHFAHLSTRVLVTGDASRPASGQTLWFGESERGAAGVAWDWVCLSYGVVAIADPMALITNMQLVNTAGDVLAPMESVRQLNEIVHMLPWQGEVQRALAQCH